MDDQCMRIGRSAGLAILPCLASVQASPKRTRFYCNKDTTRDQWIGSNPANVARVWPWWKTPGRCRWQFAQRGKLMPGVATILRAEKCAWLGARIDNAIATCLLQCAYCD